MLEKERGSLLFVLLDLVDAYRAVLRKESEIWKIKRKILQFVKIYTIINHKINK